LVVSETVTTNFTARKEQPMSLAILLDALDADLTRALPRNTRSFAETRARRPVLAPFDTLIEIRDALGATSTLTVDARRALVGVLVEEAQKGTSAVWSSLLALAFAPMLHRLRRRVTASRSDEEIDSAILAAFFGAVRSVRPGAYTSLALRYATQREIFDARRADRSLGRPASFDEDFHSNPVLHEVESRDTVDDVLRALESEGAAEILDVLIATRGRDESLRAYVARTCPNRRDRASRYEHLCRARLRFERELRDRMVPLAA
jgi:hypothetical protein